MLGALPRPTGTAPQSESLWRCIRDVLRAALWLVSGFEGGRTAAILGRTIVGGLDMIKTAIWIHLDPSLNLVRPSAHELDADARRRIGWMDAPRSPGLPPLVPQQAWVNG